MKVQQLTPSQSLMHETKEQHMGAPLNQINKLQEQIKIMQRQRRRRKNRRQRKMRNRTQEVDPMSKINVLKSILKGNNDSEILENAHNTAFAISLRNKDNYRNNSNLIVNITKFKNDSQKLNRTSVKPPNSTLAPLTPNNNWLAIAVNNLVGNSSDADTVRMQASHRKESLRQRLEHDRTATRNASNHSTLVNKYNIDYDDKLEDEFEIIMKDE